MKHRIADTFLSVRIDRRTTGYHVVQVSVQHSDTKFSDAPDSQFAPMTWGFVPITYRAQSDREGRTADRGIHCYGHEQPELSGELRDLKRTVAKADALQRRLEKMEAELGPVRTPGDLLRRIATAVGRNVPVWFESAKRDASYVASEVDRSLSLFLRGEVGAAEAIR